MKIKELQDRATEYLSSQDGQNNLKRALIESQKDVERLKKSREVTEEMLHRKFDI